MRLRVRARSREAVLLVRERDDAKRAARPLRELPDEARRFDRDPEARGVVHGALPEVPRIEVAAEEDDLLRLLAARDLADDVRRDGVGKRPGREREAHAYGPPVGEQAVDEVGVGIREGRGRNLRDSLFVAQRARVRESRVRRGHGADEDAHGAQLRGARGRGPADRNGRAVAGPVRLALHDLPDEDDPALSPSRRARPRPRGTAPRRRRPRRRPRAFPRCRRARRATSGTGTGETISPLSSPRSQCGTVTGSAWTFVKPCAVSAALGPRDRAGVARRTGEPRADGVREAADRVVRAVRLRGRVDEALERDPEIGAVSGARGGKSEGRGGEERSRGNEARALHESLSSSLFSSTCGPGSASSLR